MKDSLENDELRENPFRMPEGYLEDMEFSVMHRISREKAEAARPGWKAVLRPIFYMAAMFGLVFGIGYGVMALTHTSDRMEEVQTDFLADESGFELADDEDIDYYVNEYITVNQITTYLAQE